MTTVPMRRPLDEHTLAAEVMRRPVSRLTSSVCAWGTAPRLAGRIIQDAHIRRSNWCEWVYSRCGCDASKPVREAFQQRRLHTGYMAPIDRGGPQARPPPCGAREQGAPVGQLVLAKTEKLL